MNARALALTLTSAIVVFSQGATCGQSEACECSACLSAIDLAVFDAEGGQLPTGWTVEATLDGTPIDDISNCDADFRIDNVCSFGSGTGIYRITVRGLDFEPLELAVRVAAKSGENCCAGICVASTPVNAFLAPSDEEQ